MIWVEQTHRLAVIILTLDPALAVELEAVGALVEPVEFGRWRVTGDGHAGAWQPCAILCALDLKGSPFWAGKKKKSNI